MTLKRSTDILEHNMIWSPFDKKLIKQFKKNQKNFKNMLRVRFIGTSSGDYEFKPYDLIGEVIFKKCAHTVYNIRLQHFCHPGLWQNWVMKI